MDLPNRVNYTLSPLLTAKTTAVPSIWGRHKKTIGGSFLLLYADRYPHVGSWAGHAASGTDSLTFSALTTCLGPFTARATSSAVSTASSSGTWPCNCM